MGNPIDNNNEKKVMLHILGQIGMWIAAIITVAILVEYRKNVDKSQIDRVHKTGRIVLWGFCAPLGLWRSIKHDSDVRAAK